MVVDGVGVGDGVMLMCEEDVWLLSDGCLDEEVDVCEEEDDDVWDLWEWVLLVMVLGCVWVRIVMVDVCVMMDGDG